MSGSNRHLLEAVAVISDNDNLRACVRESSKGAVVCGAVSLLAGALMGPRGLAIGGAIGGLTALMTSGSFRSVSAILLNDLSPQQQNKLVRLIKAAVSNMDISELIFLLLGNTDIRASVLNTVKQFVRNDLHMQII